MRFLFGNCCRQSVSGAGSAAVSHGMMPAIRDVRQQSMRCLLQHGSQAQTTQQVGELSAAANQSPHARQQPGSSRLLPRQGLTVYVESQQNSTCRCQFLSGSHAHRHLASLPAPGCAILKQAAWQPALCVHVLPSASSNQSVVVFAHTHTDYLLGGVFNP